MTALVSMFNFLTVYLNYFATIICGGLFSVNDFVNEEQKAFARQIIINVSNSEFVASVNFYSSPILLLFVGVIVCFAVIRLVHRLVRG